MKKFVVIGVGALCLMLGGCLETLGIAPGSAVAENRGFENPYAGVAGHEYQTLAAMMDVNGDKRIARRFVDKAETARSGLWPHPDPVGNNTSPELNAAADSLDAALNTVMNDENALWLARAQVNFDCWLNTEDGAPGSPLLDGCRRDFDKAMQGLSLPEGMLQTQSVYFNTDSSSLTPETQKRLHDISGVLRINRHTGVRLVGSTDRKANYSLALRRAMAVRNALAQHGIDPARMAVAGEERSSEMLGQQSAETGKDPQGRRVDILLEVTNPQPDEAM